MTRAPSLLPVPPRLTLPQQLTGRGASCPATAARCASVAASDGADDALANELAAAGEDEVAAGALAVGIEHLLWASRVADSRELREAALLRAVEWLGVAGDVPRAHGFRDEVISCRDPRKA